MSHNSKVFDGTVGHHQPMLEIKTTSIVRGTLDDVPEKRTVFGMSPLNHQLHRGLRRWRAFKYSKGFIRPEDFSTHYVPTKTAGAAQQLRLCQVCFTPAQRLLRLLCSGDIHHRPNKLDDS